MSLILKSPPATLKDAFSKVNTREQLAQLLEVDDQTLRYLLYRSANYKTFNLPKKSGGSRVISAPATSLKLIQRKLNQVLLAVYGGRSSVHGFARGRSIRSNAQSHVGARVILNFDLLDFFPTINFGRVRGLFLAKPYSRPNAVATVLAQICCHKGALPAGAPTSPTVANMICGKMDSALKQFASLHGVSYTRYADDITISTVNASFSNSVAKRDVTSNRWVVGDGLQDIVVSNGFKINESKTRLLNRNACQEVTGITINTTQRGLNVKPEFVRQVRAMLHAWSKFGKDAAEVEFWAKYDRRARQKRKPCFARVVRGKIEHVGFVRGRDDIIYVQLLQKFKKLNPRLRLKAILAGKFAQDEVIHRAVWVLEQKDGEKQGTAFALDKVGFLTAAHVLADALELFCPAIDSTRYAASPVSKHDHVDVARIDGAARPLVTLELGSSVGLRVGDSIRVLGFPTYQVGSTVSTNWGRVSAIRPYHGVTHYVVDCPIVRGASGGPVLDSRNRVIGIAIKGQQIPWRVGDDDQLSSFVPIEVALDSLS